MGVYGIIYLFHSLHVFAHAKKCFRCLPSTEIGQFQKVVGGLIELVDKLAKEAETEKMKAIGARNLLKSVEKQREAQQQQLQALIVEKKMQLERYRIEYEALSKVEAEQNEFIDQFILQK
ncbi:intraflagellar transport protein 20 homolog [Megalops cyprinoides]|uniref:intraflagellar transport protein 20 homolog n=1 Tax=Megalops cyprinoides TaxID=118141 RepID=UPI001865683E|nr:intraflagellar transport protein 20 homolog [Megalops cyprinoides]